MREQAIPTRSLLPRAGSRSHGVESGSLQGSSTGRRSTSVVPLNKIFVGGLAWGAGTPDLDYFRKYGEIEDAGMSISAILILLT